NLDSTSLVEDSKPAWLHPVLLVGPSRPDILQARNLNALAQVIQHMENLVLHQKAAMVKVIAQAAGLGVAQLPMPNFNGVNPRPIEDFIAVDINDLFDRSCVDSRQPPHALRELALGLIRVRTPTGPAAA